MAAPWTSAWTMATRRVDSVTIIVLLLMPLQVLLLSGGRGDPRCIRGIRQLDGQGGEIYFFLFRKYSIQERITWGTSVSLIARSNFRDPLYYIGKILVGY